MSFSRRAQWIRGIGPSAGLLVLLAAVDLAALWGIVVARRNALDLERSDLELQTRLHAGAFESALANLYADLALLSETPSLRTWAADPASGAETVEATLASFLAAHPSLLRVQVTAHRPAVPPLELGGVGGGVSPAGAGDRADLPAAAVRGRTLLGNGPGHLDAWLDPRALLRGLAPGIRGVELSPSPPAGSLPPGALVAAAPVRDERWSPPIRRWVVRSEDPAQQAGSLDDTLSRLRRILIANAAVILLTLVLGAAGLRHVRHAARLEAEASQEKRIRELEASVLHAERLASLGRMAAGIAHEINNPLEGMTNYFRLLEEDLDRGDVDSARRMTAGVGEGMARIAGVTHQVLSFADPREAPLEDLELCALVDRTLAFLRGNRALAHLELRRSDDAVPTRVRGNPTRLSQLLLNLSLNAADAQPDGGEIEIRVGKDEGSAILEVLDRGPGLPDDLVAQLFEPFVSGRGSTGLGLALCRRVAEEHGGTIDAFDRADGGACFRVRLPLAPNVQEGDPPWAPAPRS